MDVIMLPGQLAITQRYRLNNKSRLLVRSRFVYNENTGGELIDYAAEKQRENARPELTSQIEDLDNVTSFSSDFLI